MDGHLNYCVFKICYHNAFQLRIDGYSSQLSTEEEGTRIITVDDISISPGACPPPGNCDFEDCIGCSWNQDQLNDDFDWLVLQADIMDNIGGPV